MNQKLMKVQDLWKAHNQILMTIFLKKLKKLYANMNMIIKNAWN